MPLIMPGKNQAFCVPNGFELIQKFTGNECVLTLELKANSVTLKCFLRYQ